MRSSNKISVFIKNIFVFWILFKESKRNHDLSWFISMYWNHCITNISLFTGRELQVENVVHQPGHVWEGGGSLEVPLGVGDHGVTPDTARVAAWRHSSALRRSESRGQNGINTLWGWKPQRGSIMGGIHILYPIKSSWWDPSYAGKRLLTCHGNPKPFTRGTLCVSESLYGIVRAPIIVS